MKKEILVVPKQLSLDFKIKEQETQSPIIKMPMVSKDNFVELHGKLITFKKEKSLFNKEVYKTFYSLSNHLDD